jgi:hypothetical protein
VIKRKAKKAAEKAEAGETELVPAAD